MNYTVPMPSLGADMDQGKLMDWKIKAGDLVKKGQTIAVVETTKSAVEIESFREGKVLELKAKPGEEIRVGSPIAIMEVEGEAAASVTAPPAPAPRIRISPAARRYAEENKIPLSELKGSGPEGQIELKDVKVRQPSGINLREAIARAMARSKKEIPHYYLMSQILLDTLMTWLDEKNQQLPPEQRLMLPVLFIRAIVEALKENPQMNAHYENGTLEVKTSINVGIAIALRGGGVMVPAILDAQKMTLAELNSAFADLIFRTRKGELRNRELTEGTFTVTNVGDLGTDEVFGIIFPPQVSLVGLGRVHRSAVIDDGEIRAGFVVNVTLSADHRVTDGLSGARFLSRIETIIMNPKLLEEDHEYRGSEVITRGDISRSSSRDRV